MRWAILTACLLVLAISAGLLIEASEVTRPPAGGIAILYIGVVVALGFAGVGTFAWARRPKNLTGVLMVAVGTTVALTGLQFLDTPALFAIGADTSTLVPAWAAGVATAKTAMASASARAIRTGTVFRVIAPSIGDPGGGRVSARDIILRAYLTSPPACQSERTRRRAR